MTNTHETPCLVDTARGVSVLYNNRHLFSRFDPQKAFLSILNNTTILDESLILCISPVLDFPVNSILNKLQNENLKKCFVLAIEKDTLLYDFFHSQIKDSLKNENFASLYIQNENEISLLLEGIKTKSILQGKDLPKVSNFRRVIVFEASSEVNQNKEYYANVFRFTQNSISQFWKNRMTLVRLGKLFSTNTLKNISHVSHSVKVQKESITKPILVVAAGSSLDGLIPFIKKVNNNVYVLAIAAAIQPLQASEIRIDGIISLEGQYATDKAFIGFNNTDIPLFTDIASRTNILKKFNYISLFLSEYTKNPLIERITQTFPQVPVFPPLGSVGITATELAIFLRKSDDIPIFVCGLDFAFPIGKTHANETPHIKEALNVSNKLRPFGNTAMSFRHGTFMLEDSTKVSDAGLKVYADLYNERYKNTKKLYDLSHYGMINDIQTCTENKAINLIEANTTIIEKQIPTMINCEDKVDSFYKAEKERLITIKDMLTGKITLDENTLLHLLEECSYLYMHFPDGHLGANLRQDFLNRVRGEVDVFLKAINN